MSEPVPDESALLLAKRIESLKKNYADGKRLSSTDKALIGVEIVADDTDEIFGGTEGIAQAIRTNFQIPCHRATVSLWLRGKQLPTGVPPMPPPHISGRHLKSLVFPWVEKYLAPAGGQSKLCAVQDYKSEKEKIDAIRAKAEFEQWQKENDERYVLKETMNAMLTAGGSIARTNTREIMERVLPRQFSEALIPMGLSQEISDAIVNILRLKCAAAFDLWQKQMRSRIGELQKEK